MSDSPTCRAHRRDRYAAAGLCALVLLSSGGSDPAADPTPDVASDANLTELGGLDTPSDGDVPLTPADASDVDTADDVPDGSGEPAGFPLGAECQTSEACASALCSPPLLGTPFQVCTQPCRTQTGCPDDFRCTLLTGVGADQQQICLPVVLCIDEDEDGFGAGPDCEGRDCDDANPDRNPNAPERCNAFDDDCDGRIDETPTDAGVECDTGNAGICRLGVQTCNAIGFLECIAPTPTVERCDGLDNDCDGSIDEESVDAPLSQACYDGPAGTLDVGICQGGQRACADGTLQPCVGQRLPTTEVCNSTDDDCDGRVDEDFPQTRWWPDLDGDGRGDASVPPFISCSQPADHVDNDDDCNDEDPDTYLGAPEIPGDGIDQNCDGLEACFADLDEDRYRPSTNATTLSDDLTCSLHRLASVAIPAGDCDDNDALRNPGVLEIPGDGIDQNCDALEACYIDQDRDLARNDEGRTALTSRLLCVEPGLVRDTAPIDCDDNDPLRHPSATEICGNGIDEDCDGGDAVCE